MGLGEYRMFSSQGRRGESELRRGESELRRGESEIGSEYGGEEGLGRDFD